MDSYNNISILLIEFQTFYLLTKSSSIINFHTLALFIVIYIAVHFTLGCKIKSSITSIMLTKS